ncbi:GNAT family N-acetyltransferase [Actinacidiphila sp. bgisy160]|uniref:GNAT family N-acetyltransferase n=1 Tax=Actinacidiphila sp. bgisy160 TaxID=3413796 RepID=UPI003D74A8D1
MTPPVRPAGPEAITTPRLVLEPLLVEHAEEMAAVLSDPGLHAFTGGTPYDAPGLRTRYARLVAGSGDPAVSWWNWVIRLPEEDRLTGTVQATVAWDTPDGVVAEVAWVVGSPWQGRGIAGEAAVALVGRLAALPVDRVIAHVHPGHRASAAVAAAAGLTPTSIVVDGETRWQRDITAPGGEKGR